MISYFKVWFQYLKYVLDRLAVVFCLGRRTVEVSDIETPLLGREAQSDTNNGSAESNDGDLLNVHTLVTSRNCDFEGNYSATERSNSEFGSGKESHNTKEEENSTATEETSETQVSIKYTSTTSGGSSLIEDSGILDATQTAIGLTNFDSTIQYELHVNCARQYAAKQLDPRSYPVPNYTKRLRKRLSSWRERARKFRLLTERPLLPVHNSRYEWRKGSKTFEFSIMTWNIKLGKPNLLQKGWIERWHEIMEEILYYEPDVLCLQEITMSRLKKLRRSLCSEYDFCFSSMNFGNIQGNIIGYRKDSFALIKKVDAGVSSCPIPCGQHQRPFAVVCLEIPGTRDCLIIGNLHTSSSESLTYHRTAQMVSALEFMNSIYIDLKKDYTPHMFFCGDMNTQPFEPPYHAITVKPVVFNADEESTLNYSLMYPWNFHCNVESDSPISIQRRKARNKKGELGEVEDFHPKNFTGSPESRKCVKELSKRANELPLVATSVYAARYYTVHGVNAGLYNEVGEPTISFWRDTSRGLLDYIFVVSPWDAVENYGKPAAYNRVRNSMLNKTMNMVPDIPSRDPYVKVVELLMLPEYPSIAAVTECLPEAEVYPSDHFSLMATFEILLSKKSTE